MAINKIYKNVLKQLEEQRGSLDDPRRAMGCIQAVQPHEGIMAFCRRTGMANDAKYNKADILKFMIWNAGTLENYQTTGEKRGMHPVDGYPLIKADEVFFCCNPSTFELPQQIAFFELPEKGYTEHTQLPDGWEWDNEHAFEEYDNVGRRIEFLYRLLPQFDEFGIAAYKVGNTVFYRVVLHRPNMKQLVQDLKEKHEVVKPKPQKNKTQTQKDWEKVKNVRQKPIQQRKTEPKPTNIEKNKPATEEKKIKEVEVSTIKPDAVGFCIEISASGNIDAKILNLFSLSLHAGSNYVVFLRGPYRYIPFRYAYYGYQGLISKSIGKQSLVDALKKGASKAKSLIPLSGSISAGLSIPILAWKDVEEDAITPDSWEGWFIADTLSIKAKAGLGVSFGGSWFEGITFPGSVSLDQQEKVWEMDILKRVLQITPSGEPEWVGGNIDIGYGPGTPNITYSHDYITFYTCRNKLNGVNYETMSSIDFYNRWHGFLNPKYIGDDAYFLLCKLPYMKDFLNSWG